MRVQHDIDSPTAAAAGINAADRLQGNELASPLASIAQHTRKRLQAYLLKAAYIPDFYWQVGQESNLQPAVLETAALPIELPTYAKASAAYTKPARGVKRKGGVAHPACC
jgi:hypothetical protein